MSLSSRWSKVPQPLRYAIPITTSAVVSAGWVLWAIHRHCSSEAERGGGVATMVALTALFLRPDYGLEVYEERIQDLDASLTELARLKEELDAHTQWLRTNSSGQFHQNLALVIASLIGTFFWTFGDLIAKHFIK